MSRPRRRRHPLSHEARVMVHALLAAMPAALVALGFLWLEPHSPKVRWTLTLVCVGAWTALALTVREEVARPLQTLSNLLAAYHVPQDNGIVTRPTRQQPAIRAE